MPDFRKLLYDLAAAVNVYDSVFLSHLANYLDSGGFFHLADYLDSCGFLHIDAH